MEIASWAWLIVPLGVCRAMQIVIHDRILKGPRELILRHVKPAEDGGYIAYLLTCPWCVSTQLGLLTAALLAWDESRRPTLWVLLALATSLVAVCIDRLIDRVPVLADPPPPPTPQGVADAFERHEQHRS